MDITQQLLYWYDSHQRDLPWRHTRNVYHIWLSEIMLQQTRVETVKDYYRRFLEAYPDIAALARAPQEDVLKLWEGLGYYSRARNLHQAAKRIVEQYKGIFPSEYRDILSLPGIGAYTAGAISSIAFGQKAAAIDGNVKRLASRLFGIRQTIDAPGVTRYMEDCIMKMIPEDRPGDFNQALIELGATLCNRSASQCEQCPVRDFCDAYTEGDAPLLPIHDKKPLKKTIDMAVCLLFYQGKVLLYRREEKLLNGLYVFRLFEDETDPREIEKLLSKEGITAEYIASKGHFRHEFTHKIWEMELMQFEVRVPPDKAYLHRHAALWVSGKEMLSYPIPTAMKAAKEVALLLLNDSSF